MANAFMVNSGRANETVNPTYPFLYNLSQFSRSPDVEAALVLSINNRLNKDERIHTSLPEEPVIIGHYLHVIKQGINNSKCMSPNPEWDRTGKEWTDPIVNCWILNRSFQIYESFLWENQKQQYLPQPHSTCWRAVFKMCRGGFHTSVSCHTHC